MSKYAGSRYKVLKAYKEENLKWNSTVWTFYWEDRVTLEQGGVNFEVSHELLYKGYNEPQFMLAEAAAHAMHDQEFKYAVLDWYETQKYSNHYNDTSKWYSLGTTGISPAVFETEKFIGNDGKTYLKAKEAWLASEKYSVAKFDVSKANTEKLMSEVYGGKISFEYDGSGEVSNAEFGKTPSSLVPQLPGVRELVYHPKAKNDEDEALCGWGKDKHVIQDIIMHLNDRHRWTREEIADWLETLDVDLRFKTPEQKAEEKKRKELDEAKALLVDYEKQVKSTTTALKVLKEKVKECTKNIETLQEALNVED